MTHSHRSALGSGLRIFLVDDHALYREGLREALDIEDDLDVVGESASATGALQRVIETDPHVVIMDVRLPDGDGLDICHEIVSRTSARCVILTSAVPSHADRTRAARAGASAYLVKGSTLSDVLTEIRRAGREQEVKD